MRTANKDDYRTIISRFIDAIEDKTPYRCFILHGSVNNDEHIPYFSDIDLNVFVENEMMQKTIFQEIRKAIIKSLGEFEVVFNVWTLLSSDYPYQYYGNFFDFVRRYCLKAGTVLLGKNELNQIKLAENITIYEKDLCVKSISSFQIRMGRLLTNPTAITDVNKVESKLILQQGIAYYFHSMRYFNAFWGNIITSIKTNLTFFLGNKALNEDIKTFSLKVYEMREKWEQTSRLNFEKATWFLFNVVAHVNQMLAILRNNMDEHAIDINYR